YLSPVGDLNVFAGANQAHVLAEPIFQLSQSDLLHTGNVASWGHIVNASLLFGSASCLRQALPRALGRERSPQPKQSPWRAGEPGLSWRPELPQAASTGCPGEERT